jgi:hypothetical protein
MGVSRNPESHLDTGVRRYDAWDSDTHLCGVVLSGNLDRWCSSRQFSICFGIVVNGGFPDQLRVCGGGQTGRRQGKEGIDIEDAGQQRGARGAAHPGPAYSDERSSPCAVCRFFRLHTTYPRVHKRSADGFALCHWLSECRQRLVDPAGYAIRRTRGVSNGI